MSAASLKLSPALKALIALPSAKGAPIPAPAAATLKALFDRIRTAGERGGVTKDAWLSLGAATLVTLNSPATLCALYDYAAEGKADKGAEAAEIMRETGLKCITFGGVPRAINNLGALRDHLGTDVTDKLHTEVTRAPKDIADLYKRGRGLWDGIYEPHATKLVAKLGDSHPDLPVHIINSHYGPLLADPPTTPPPGAFRLGRVLTSMIAVAALRAQTGVGPQVTSHVFGLKKALLPGGGGDGLSVAGQEWLTSDEGVKWVLESVDDMSKVVRGDEAPLKAKL